MLYKKIICLFLVVGVLLMSSTVMAASFTCECSIFDSEYGETIISQGEIGFFSIPFVFMSGYVYLEEYSGGVLAGEGKKFGPFFRFSRADLGLDIRGIALLINFYAKGYFAGYPIECHGKRTFNPSVGLTGG